MTTAADESLARGGRLHFGVPDTDIEVWLLDMDTLDAAARERLLALPSDLDRRASEARRLARAVVRHWLGELLGRAPEALALSTPATGKPALPDAGIAFNASHTGHWLALAWSRSLAEVGMDIEQLGQRRNFAAMTRRYFHPHEAALWERTPVAGQEDAWLRTWTRKEAVLKGHGLGLRLILRNLDTTGNTISHASIGRWLAHTRHAGPGERLMVSVAWPRPATPD